VFSPGRIGTGVNAKVMKEMEKMGDMKDIPLTSNAWPMAASRQWSSLKIGTTTAK